MPVKDKYHHSISLTKDMEEKLDKVRGAGYSIPQILDVGLDSLMEYVKGEKVETKKAEF